MVRTPRRCAAFSAHPRALIRVCERCPSNNLRVAGTNIDACDISGILIDGGAAIDIVGSEPKARALFRLCCLLGPKLNLLCARTDLIEGNAGPAIILSAGLFGAPMGITIESNYCR